MTRTLALTLAAGLLACRALGAPTQPDLSSDTTAFDEMSGETVLSGRAVLQDEGILLSSDEIRFNQRTQQSVASGHVVLTQLGDRILADRIAFNRADGSFSAVNIRIGKFPFYIEGPRAEGHLDRTGKGGEITIHDATVTYGEPGKYQPTVRARTLVFSPGHFLRISQADLGIGDYNPIPFSNVAEDLAKKTGLGSVSLEGGYRHNLGPYIDAAVHLPVFTGFSAGPDIGVYTFRGVMAGPVANYDFEDGSNSEKGSLRSGYIYDYGSRLTDILNNPVPANRAFIEWQHDQVINENLTIKGNLEWSSDSEVIRDFHTKEFVPIQEPDNFLESVYTGTDFLASAIARFQPDAYYPVQERLPEIRFDLLPTPVFEGILVRFDAGFAHLEENPPSGGAHLQSDRLDAFLGASRPFSYKGIVDLTPVVGARYTEYWDTTGAAVGGGTSRTLAEMGADADLKLSGTWDYSNDYLGINGLRHLLTPNVSWRFIPDASRYVGWIPPIDRGTFTSYLPVLELGDMTAIDQLQSENILRLAVNNTLQTRDKAYGSRDLLTFDVEDDVRFQRDPGQTDFSDIYAQLHFMPARWLDLRFEDSVSSSGFQQRARDAMVTFREAELWSVGLGLGYLSDQYAKFVLPGLGPFPVEGLNTYHADARYRINEQYEAFARGDYDYRAHQFVDEFYGVSQRLSNTWIIEYAIGISNGPNKGQGHFGFNVNLNLIRF